MLSSCHKVSEWYSVNTATTIYTVNTVNTTNTVTTVNTANRVKTVNTVNTAYTANKVKKVNKVNTSEPSTSLGQCPSIFLVHIEKINVQCSWLDPTDQKEFCLFYVQKLNFANKNMLLEKKMSIW